MWILFFVFFPKRGRKGECVWENTTQAHARTCISHVVLGYWRIKKPNGHKAKGLFLFQGKRVGAWAPQRGLSMHMPFPPPTKVMAAYRLFFPHYFLLGGNVFRHSSLVGSLYQKNPKALCIDIKKKKKKKWSYLLHTVVEIHLHFKESLVSRHLISRVCTSKIRVSPLRLTIGMSERGAALSSEWRQTTTDLLNGVQFHIKLDNKYNPPSPKTK